MRELCKLTKNEIGKRLAELAAELPQGKYICRKCARIAHDKRLLCKPQDIKKIKQP